MKITQAFDVARPAADVWAFFSDVPAVARCLPGAELTADKGDGTYAGKVSIKLGPFGAAFEGEATVKHNDDARTGRVDGKGVDKRGGSHSKMVMDYAVTGDDGSAHVTIDAEVTLAGPIAQFGRTGLISETAKLLIGQFVGNLERELAARAPVAVPVAAGASGPRGATGSWATATASAAPAPPQSLNALSLLWGALKAWLRGLFGSRS